MKALRPGTLGPLQLRNRVIKTATYEGMSPGGRPGAALVEHHRRLAEGGVALTTVAYGAVHADGRTFSEQLLLSPEHQEGLAAIATAVHGEGGLVSMQLAHCGGFSKNPDAVPKGPSSAFNAYGAAYGRPWIRAMDEGDIARTIESFVDAARRMAQAGFDAVEVHAGHGYLLSQFFSPVFNRRRDRWGGSLQGRARLSLEVVRQVRAAVPELAVLVKMNLHDGVRGGADEADAVAFAGMLMEAGAHGLVLSGGLVQRSAFYLLRGQVPMRQMIASESSLAQRVAMRMFAPFLVRPVPYRDRFFAEQALQIRRAVQGPLVLLGGVTSGPGLEASMDEGFDFVAMGRALLYDPDFVRHLQQDPSLASGCTHCNRCVAEMDRGGVRCVLIEQAP